VRKEEAKKRGWRSISQIREAAPRLRAGFTAEFAERPDGYSGLRKAYGLRFKDVRDLDPSLMYEAIAGQEVDVICAFATDGRIEAYGLMALEDDRHFFPPYHASPVVRARVLTDHPELRRVFSSVQGLIDDPAMQRLNHEVDAMKKSPRRVAGDFLESRGLLGSH
jgi:glycine betaine/choline ABC-type transport system substrate-binding protein